MEQAQPNSAGETGIELDDLSEIVVNATMNRGRGFAGADSYARELRPFDVTAFLSERNRGARWLDACCGEGRALAEAGAALPAVEIVGVDLYGEDFVPSAHLPNLRLIAGDVAVYDPEGGAGFDLITCVHGLHYLLDKLGAVAHLARHLRPGGVLIGHLNAANVRAEPSSGAPMGLPHHLRRASEGGDFAMRFGSHRIRVERIGGSSSTPDFGLTFLLATGSERPNFTGTTVVDSWYAPLG